MAILKIVKFDDPMIRKTSRPVDEITPRIERLIDDMIDTMRDAGGCGLAAVQVGVLRRIVVIEVEEVEVYVLINPKIIAYSGNQEECEGCLSNPGKYGITKRPMRVRVEAFDRFGNEVSYEGELTEVAMTPTTPNCPEYVVVNRPQVKLEDFPMDADGFYVIFNGNEKMQGWRGYGKDNIPSRWSVEDGCIKFTGSGGGEAQTGEGGDLLFAHKFKNFIFS